MSLRVAIGILVLAVLGGFGFYYYQTVYRPAHEGVACTQEAKLCPDGSYVGRTGPNCEFAACPGATSTPGTTGTGGAPVVGVGEHCGGFIQNAPVCAAGLHCQLTVSRPDTGGVCVSDTNGIAPYHSGVRGTVMLGPTCPVMQNPPAAGCADKPYATTVTVFRVGDSVHAFATGQSTADGTFSFSLPPGAYTLDATGGSTLPRCNTASVTVPAEGYVSSTISCDTGIR